jgi:hypothetical protein
MGQFNYNTDWSSVTWTGSTISSKFSTTTVNQQVVLFERENNKILTCNTLTVTADNTDLYFTIIKGNVFLDGDGLVRKLDGELYDYTNSPTFCVPAETSMSFNGLKATGIRFANVSGAKYNIGAIGYFSDDRYETSALTYEQIREQATGTNMSVSVGDLEYANLRQTADHTSLILKKLINGTQVPVFDVVLGTYVNGTYFWVATEYDGVSGFINYNSLMPVVN